MVNINKKTKKGSQDFKHIKSKVGKKIKPATQTSTKFRSRQIYVPSQSLVAEKGDVLSSKGLSCAELFIQTKHYSGAVRKEGLIGLKQIIGNYEGFAAANFGGIFNVCLKLLSDEEKEVRDMELQVCRELFKEVTNAEVAITPFVGVASVYIVNALNHLDLSVRRDALQFLGLLLDVCPHTLLETAEIALGKFLPSIVSLLGAEAQRHGASSAARQVVPGKKQNNSKSKGASEGISSKTTMSQRAKSVKGLLSFLQRVLCLEISPNRSLLSGSQALTLEWSQGFAGQNTVLVFRPTARIPALIAQVNEKTDGPDVMKIEFASSSVKEDCWALLWTRLQQMWEEALEREQNLPDLHVLELVPQVFTAALHLARQMEDTPGGPKDSLLGKSSALSIYMQRVSEVYPLHGSEGAGVDGLPTSVSWTPVNMSIAKFVATTSKECGSKDVGMYGMSDSVATFISAILASTPTFNLFSESLGLFLVLEILLTSPKAQIEDSGWQPLIQNIGKLYENPKVFDKCSMQLVTLNCNLIYYCMEKAEQNYGIEQPELFLRWESLRSHAITWLQNGLTWVLRSKTVASMQKGVADFNSSCEQLLGLTLDIVKQEEVCSQKSDVQESKERFPAWIIQNICSFINCTVLPTLSTESQQLLIKIMYYIQTLPASLLHEIPLLWCSGKIPSSTRNQIIEVIHHRRKVLSVAEYLNILIQVMESTACIAQKELFDEVLLSITLAFHRMRGATSGLNLISALCPVFSRLLSKTGGQSLQSPQKQQVALSCILACIQSEEIKFSDIPEQLSACILSIFTEDINDSPVHSKCGEQVLLNSLKQGLLQKIVFLMEAILQAFVKKIEKWNEEDETEHQMASLKALIKLYFAQGARDESSTPSISILTSRLKEFIHNCNKKQASEACYSGAQLLLTELFLHTSVLK